MNNQNTWGMFAAAVILLPAVCGAEDSMPLASMPTPKSVEQVIVQIGGRFCEYLPQKV